jgi:hypothetical protein
MPRYAKILILLPLSLLLATCQGLPGEQGPAGPGTRIVLSGALEIGPGIEVQLPPEAGTMDDPPVIACYVGPYSDTDAYREYPCDFKDAQDGTHIVVGLPGVDIQPPGYPDRNYRIVAVY